MTSDHARVKEVLRLERRAVDVDPLETYWEIGIRSFGRGIFHKESTSGAELGNKRVFRIEAGDLVISNVFAWEGAIAIASEAESGRIGSHRFMTFVPIDDRIDTGWARWWFLSEPGLESVRAASPGSAGRNRTLAVDRFEALEIPLPSIDNQRRMTAWLDGIAAEARVLEMLAHEAEPVVRALLTSVRRQQFQGVHGNVRFLREVAHVEMGQSPPGGTYNDRGEGLPLLNGPTEFGRDHPTPRQWTTTVTKVAQPGDLLISIRATIGRMNWADQPYCIGRGLAAIRPRPDLDAQYLRHALMHLAPEIASRTAGSTFANLSGEKLLNLPIPVPPLDEQLHVAHRLTRAEDASERAAALLDRSSALRGAILPAAVNKVFSSL